MIFCNQHTKYYFVNCTQIKHLKVCEAELAALRGLTNEQRESIAILTQQLEEMKVKLDDSTNQLEETTIRIRKMAKKYAS